MVLRLAKLPGTKWETPRTPSLEIEDAAVLGGSLLLGLV